MSLTQEQADLYQQIVAWTLDPSKEAVLNAMAGTGKSFLINYINEHLLADHIKMCNLLGVKQTLYNVQISATTNKAVTSLNEIGCETAQTTCQSIGAVLAYNPKLSTKALKLRHTNKIVGTLLIVDECSMVDWMLYQMITQKLGNDCKVLYCGDKNQLAPVKCIGGISPIYLNKHLETFNLTKLVRSKKHQQLQDLAYQLHRNVESKTFEPIKTFKGIIDWYTAKEDQIQELDKFKNENYNAKVITYTNEKSGLYTDYIRQLRGYTEPLEVGETYISNSYYKFAYNKGHISTDSTIKILTKPYLKTLTLANDELLPFYQAQVRINNNNTKEVWIAADKNEFRAKLKKYRNYDDILAAELESSVLLLDYAHACTIHKAQGITVNTIYIDCEDISKCRNADTVARLLYVAATRATDRIVFLGKLNPKYGGFV